MSQEEINRMVQDAEKYNKVQDDEQRKMFKAKEALEKYAYQMRNIINDKKIGDKLDAAGKKKIEAAIRHVTQWIDGIEHAEAHEFEDKLIGLELICIPIIAKISTQPCLHEEAHDEHLCSPKLPPPTLNIGDEVTLDHREKDLIIENEQNNVLLQNMVPDEGIVQKWGGRSSGKKASMYGSKSEVVLKIIISAILWDAFTFCTLFESLFSC